MIFHQNIFIKPSDFYLSMLFFFAGYLFVFSQINNNGILENFQRNLIVEKHAGSNVILINKENRIVYHHIENSNSPGDKDITEESIFPIWSMSKPITTVAILILKERGRIDFNDSVSKYLPEFTNPKCKNIDDEIVPCENDLKIIHLLTHMSGLYYYEDFMLDAIRSKDLEELTIKVSKYPLAFEPGEQFLYGLNQDVLGRIVEVITGLSFFDFLLEEIFIPLEMFNTKFFIKPNESELLQPLYINLPTLSGYNQLGITGLNDLITYDSSYKPELGSLGLLSTLEDYSNFCSMLVNQGRFKTKRILSEESCKLFTKKFADGPFSGDLDFPIVYCGLGVYVIDNSDHRLNIQVKSGVYGHGGYQSTEFFIDVENKMFAIFLTRTISSYNHRLHFMKSVYEAFEN